MPCTGPQYMFCSRLHVLRMLQLPYLFGNQLQKWFTPKSVWCTVKLGMYMSKDKTEFDRILENAKLDELELVDTLHVTGTLSVVLAVEHG